MGNHKAHVFIVDDFKDNREMYDYFLSERGFRVTLAGDGREALEKAAELQPDVIVMDLSLPGIDGWEATRQLRADEKTRHIPVLILTAYDLGDTVPDGCQGLLTKPCLPDRMISEINRVLDARAPSGRSAQPQT